MLKGNAHTFYSIILFLLATIGASNNVYSQSTGWYGAIEFGEANPSDGDFQETTSSRSVYLGKNLTENSAIEFGYIDMDKFDFRPLDDSFVEVTGLELSAVGKMSLSESVNLFGKLGLFLWDTEGTLRGIDVGGDDGESILFGGGFDFALSQSIGSRISVLQYDDIDDVKVYTFTLGLYVNF